MDMSPCYQSSSAVKGSRGHGSTKLLERQQTGHSSFLIQGLTTRPVLPTYRSSPQIARSASSKLVVWAKGLAQRSKISEDLGKHSNKENGRRKYLPTSVPIQQSRPSSYVRSTILHENDDNSNEEPCIIIGPLSPEMPPVQPFIPVPGSNFHADGKDIYVSSPDSPSTDCKVSLDGASSVSSTNTPETTTPVTPVTPGGQLEVPIEAQGSGLCTSMGAATTMDDIHEDIKRAYEELLRMLQDGAFDEVEPSPVHTHLSPRPEQLSRKFSRISRIIASSTAAGTRWSFRPNMEVNEESAEMLNKKLIDMLMQDLISSNSTDFDQMPHSTAPSSQLGSHMYHDVSYPDGMDDRATSDISKSKQSMDDIEHFNGLDDYTIEAVADVSVATAVPTRQYLQKGSLLSLGDSAPTTPGLSSTQSSPRPGTVTLTPQIDPTDPDDTVAISSPLPPSVINSYSPINGYSESAQRSYDPQTEIESQLSEPVIGSSDGAYSFTRSHFSSKMKSTHSLNSSEHGPDADPTIAITHPHSPPLRKRREHSKPLPFLNRYGQPGPTVAPIPILPADLEAVYPTDTSPYEPQEGVLGVQRSKSFVIAGVRSSFGKLAALTRRLSELPPATGTVRANSETVSHTVRRSKDMFVIGDDSDRSSDS